MPFRQPETGLFFEFLVLFVDDAVPLPWRGERPLNQPLSGSSALP